jgi:hypothetical protein
MVTIELSDADFAAIAREAEVVGATPSQVIVQTLHRHLTDLAQRQIPTVAKDQITSSRGPITAEDIERAMVTTAEAIAARTGLSPDQIVAALDDRLRSTPLSALSEEEQQVAQQHFEELFGSADSGDPRSADNDRIEADLAREYALGLGWNER